MLSVNVTEVKPTTVKPWEHYPEVWRNETAFYNYIRGCLRKAWVRHPVKLLKLNNSRVQIPNPNPKGKKTTVWGCKCEICNNLFPMKSIEVDHKNPAGRLSSLEDIQGFTMRLLFVTEDDLRTVCKDCHGAITLAERKGISFNESRAEKLAIQAINSKKDKSILQEAGVVPGSNQKIRRTQLVELFMKEKE